MILYTVLFIDYFGFFREEAFENLNCINWKYINRKVYKEFIFIFIFIRILSTIKSMAYRKAYKWGTF